MTIRNVQITGEHTVMGLLQHVSDVRRSPMVVETLVYRGSFSMLRLKSSRANRIKELTLPLLVELYSGQI